MHFDLGRGARLNHGSLFDRLVWLGHTVKSAGSFQGPGSPLPARGSGDSAAGHGGFARIDQRVDRRRWLPPAVTKSDSRPASHQFREFIGASFDMEAAAKRVRTALLNHALLAHVPRYAT